MLAAAAQHAMHDVIPRMKRDHIHAKSIATGPYYTAVFLLIQFGAIYFQL